MPDESGTNCLTSYQPNDRLIVLARTLNHADNGSGLIDVDSVPEIKGETHLGKALYRHHSVFQNASDALIWSHFDLTYFHAYVPSKVLQELVFEQSSQTKNLLRAELLVTTPASFHLPQDWNGTAEDPERKASLEFLQVEPQHLQEYREAMLEYCGPAAAKLVSSGRFGTFRAMETVAVLYQAPEFDIDWNQIHLCELQPDGFESFGAEFSAAMRADLPEDAEFTDTFSELGSLRSIPRWTFNDPVFEDDLALAEKSGF